jgi:hypothetical protein
MKQIIKEVLNDMSDSQINLASESARETVSSLISAALKTKGSYTVFTDYELDEQKARASWVCSICGENTFEVDSDYVGSGTNHLGCELKSQEEIEDFIEDIDEQAYAQGRKSSYIQGSEEVDGMYFDDEVKGWEEAVGYKENDDNDDIPEGLKRAKELSHQAIQEGLQKQIYTEMTSDGLPEGGDAQAVKESHRLAEQIVNAKEGDWIYESPDGEHMFRRPFSNYDPKNKEEIDWETKEPTGRTFDEYPFKEKDDE